MPVFFVGLPKGMGLCRADASYVPHIEAEYLENANPTCFYSPGVRWKGIRGYRCGNLAEGGGGKGDGI